MCTVHVFYKILQNIIFHLHPPMITNGIPGPSRAAKGPMQRRCLRSRCPALGHIGSLWHGHCINIAVISGGHLGLLGIPQYQSISLSTNLHCPTLQWIKQNPQAPMWQSLNLWTLDSQDHGEVAAWAFSAVLKSDVVYLPWHRQCILFPNMQQLMKTANKSMVQRHLTVWDLLKQPASAVLFSQLQKAFFWGKLVLAFFDWDIFVYRLYRFNPLSKQRHPRCNASSQTSRLCVPSAANSAGIRWFLPGAHLKAKTLRHAMYRGKDSKRTKEDSNFYAPTPLSLRIRWLIQEANWLQEQRMLPGVASQYCRLDSKSLILKHSKPERNNAREFMRYQVKRLSRLHKCVA